MQNNFPDLLMTHYAKSSSDAQSDVWPPIRAGDNRAREQELDKNEKQYSVQKEQLLEVFPLCIQQEVCVGSGQRCDFIYFFLFVYFLLSVMRIYMIVPKDGTS